MATLRGRSRGSIAPARHKAERLHLRSVTTINIDSLDACPSDWRVPAAPGYERPSGLSPVVLGGGVGGAWGLEPGAQTAMLSLALGAASLQGACLPLAPQLTHPLGGCRVTQPLPGQSGLGMRPRLHGEWLGELGARSPIQAPSFKIKKREEFPTHQRVVKER